MRPELLLILVCPQCHGQLSELTGPSRLHCAACRLHYPVREGIPIMLPEEAVSDQEAGGQATADTE